MCRQQLLRRLTLTFSELLLVLGGSVIELLGALLRNTQQCSHELGQLLFSQTASALSVERLQHKTAVSSPTKTRGLLEI